ncbi:hypothetical protein SAMN05216419_100848 [Nitrosomonas cryotolerans]|uniref:Acetyltransferase (GNAT) domain-containing protein n=1 Tax=Nitrosomonas cryotolerans ATCC 49181 TaxID=1131553 RepID=A0A1N6I3M9_9PROT|nr:hypothetical protein [Nitrosomonas cryotolerans]SFP59422.1 hypothetical protein SAMN05216419_100848 [Nitrosomonas cryotolerans]SIO26636.1 hypothetical protein SAMN02743940_1521 [Nitrosomonas cryotolerans ATCC 49181]
MSAFRPLLRRIHTLLPDNIRRPIDIAAISLQNTLQNWHMPAHVVHALLPDGHTQGTILYLGDQLQYKSWTHQFFGQAVEPTFVGQFTLFQILSGRNSALSADIILCPLNPWTLSLFTRFGWHIIPLNVNCHVDLSKPIEELLRSKGAKEDLRVARRLGYHFDFPKNDAAIHEFFHQMLIPTAKLRHEERAFLSQWENIKRIYQNGVLISAHLDNQWVGAILLARENAETIRFANMGWRNGDEQWRKKGIVAALFNQSFIWAQTNRFKWANLGSSNPFANDGPLNFKLKWAATLTAPEPSFIDGKLEGTRSFIGVKLNLTSSATQSFLTSTPLLEYKKGQLRAIGWNAKIPPLFQRQLDLGCEWVNLAESHDINQ